MNKVQTIIVTIILIAVCIAIAALIVTLLHNLIGVPKVAAIGIGLAAGTFAVIFGVDFIKGLY